MDNEITIYESKPINADAPQGYFKVGERGLSGYCASGLYVGTKGRIFTGEFSVSFSDISFINRLGSKVSFAADGIRYDFRMEDSKRVYELLRERREQSYKDTSALGEELYRVDCTENISKTAPLEARRMYMWSVIAGAFLGLATGFGENSLSAGLCMGLFVFTAFALCALLMSVMYRDRAGEYFILIYENGVRGKGKRALIDGEFNYTYSELASVHCEKEALIITSKNGSSFWLYPSEHEKVAEIISDRIKCCQ